jgi:hypothetical protein
MEEIKEEIIAAPGGVYSSSTKHHDILFFDPALQ